MSESDKDVTTCRVEGCKKPARNRGLCTACYFYAKHGRKEQRRDRCLAAMLPARQGGRQATPARTAVRGKRIGNQAGRAGMPPTGGSAVAPPPPLRVAVEAPPAVHAAPHPGPQVARALGPVEVPPAPAQHPLPDDLPDRQAGEVPLPAKVVADTRIAAITEFAAAAGIPRMRWDDKWLFRGANGRTVCLDAGGRLRMARLALGDEPAGSDDDV